MTKDEALNLALKFLESMMTHQWRARDIYNLKDAIKEALAQPERSMKVEGPLHVVCQCNKCNTQPEQEPVGQLLEDAFGRNQVMWFNKPKDESMLYTTPPQRTWVGLTDEEWIKALELCDFDKVAAFEFFESKLKE